MSTFVNNPVASGAIVFASDHNTQGALIAAVLNGGLDNNNINAAAAIATSKLADDAGIGTAKMASDAITADKLGIATISNAAYVATSQTTTSTAYADLATTTDSITVTIGAHGLLFVSIYAGLSNSGANYSGMSFALSGTNTLAASDDRAIAWNGTNVLRLGASFLLTGLTAGSTTVKAKYNVSAGTGTFIYRRLTAIPL